MSSSDPLDAKLSGIVSGGPSFPLRNRLVRLTWQIIWVLLARWTPVPLHAWRRLVLRVFGAQIHATARVYPSASIWLPANLRLGAGAVLGPGVICYNMAMITIGERAIISQGAHLCSGTHDVDDPFFQLLARPIFISAKAWVAAEAFVGPGVTLGEGAVLGARGVATRDIPAWEIWAGNPARRLRARRRS